MRKLLAALLIGALCLCLTGTALASDNVKFKSSAYVYATAGAERTGVVIRKGSVARYMDQAGGWAQIKYGKSLGWVRVNCIKVTDDAVKVVYSATPAPEPREAVAAPLLPSGFAVQDMIASTVKTLHRMWGQSK